MESTGGTPVKRDNTQQNRTKLTGRAFYESIGSPKVILAPMVDQSEFVGNSVPPYFKDACTYTSPKAWRLLTRSFMNPEDSKKILAYSPMMHAKLFSEVSKHRDQNFQPLRSGLVKMHMPNHTPHASDIFLDGRPDVDRPLTVQFCANNPESLLVAAKYVQPFCDAVDLNLGCPQGIARKGHYGAFLQEDWDLIWKLINKLHLGLQVPVTAKIRIQETKEKTLEYAKMILSAGASLLTVHGRQREQKGHKTGLADWTVIRYLRENLPRDTVLFANGNILRHEDIARCLKETGADGVMSAEGNLHDPSIFSPPPCEPDDRLYWRGRNGKGGYRVDAVFRRYLSIIYKHVLEVPEPERPSIFSPSKPDDSNATSVVEENSEEPPAKRQKKSKSQSHTCPNLTAMKAHLFGLLRPLVSRRTEVRDALAKCRAGDMKAFEHVLTLTESAVRDGLLEYELNPEQYDVEMDLDGDEASDDITDHESSLKAVRACKRPWWCCQPYVRPLPKEALEKGSLTLGKKQQDDASRAREDSIDGKTGKDNGRMGQRQNATIEDGLDQKEVPSQAMVAG